jgi:hypothetical protein
MAFVPFLVRGTRTRLIYHLRLPNVSGAAGRRAHCSSFVPCALRPAVAHLPCDPPTQPNVLPLRPILPCSVGLGPALGGPLLDPGRDSEID